MGDGVVGGVGDEDADGVGEDAAALAEDVVVEGDVMGEGGLGGDFVFADSDGAGAGVVDERMGQLAVAGAVSEPEAVAGDVGEGDVFEGDVFDAVEVDGAGETDDGLGVALAFGGEEVLGVLEGKAAEGEVFDELVGFGVAAEAEEFGEDGGDGGGGFDRFAGERFVEEGAVAVEEPFAGGVEGGAEVFEVIALVGVGLAVGFGEGEAESEGVGGGVEGADVAALGVPGVVEDGDGVGELVGGEFVEGVADFLWTELEGAVGEVGVGFLGVGVEALGDSAGDVEVELVRGAGAGGAAVVDPELFEVPPPLLLLADFGDGGGPEAVAGGFEGREGAAAGKDGRVGGIGGLIGDGGVGRAGVGGGEDDCFGEGVAAGVDQDGDGFFGL
jgi:hypothetical protein